MSPTGGAATDDDIIEALKASELSAVIGLLCRRLRGAEAHF